MSKGFTIGPLPRWHLRQAAMVFLAMGVREQEGPTRR